MSKCTHDLTEREVACADGMCPLCLAADLAAAKADAERYRWIRDADVSDANGNEWTLYAMESLDEYIDAAIAGSKEKP